MISRSRTWVILTLVILFTAGVISYGNSGDFPKNKIVELLGIAQEHIDEGDIDGAIELLNEVKSEITGAIFQLDPGEGKINTDEWAMDITHHTPEARQSWADENEYSFAIWLTIENLTTKDLELPSFNEYSISPDGWQVDGYCSTDSSEILAGCRKQIQCTFTTPEDNFVSGNYRFIIKADTGTYTSPEPHRLEYTFHISEPEE